eukprot:g18720.t1
MVPLRSAFALAVAAAREGQAAMDVQEAARRMTAAPSCESFAPSSEELRDEPWSKWSSELLRGRRWSASVVPSAGGEELFDGDRPSQACHSVSTAGLSPRFPTVLSPLGGLAVPLGVDRFGGTRYRRKHLPVSCPAMKFMKSLLVATLAASGLAITTRTDSMTSGNPIRKVVSMMEKMADKIEDEAKKEADQYDKFECYCKKTIAELEENIRQAETNPVSQADIDKKKSEIAGLQQELKTLKEDRIAEEETLKSAEMQRGKEHESFVKEVTEEEEVVQGIDAATTALKGGEPTAFLQQTNKVSRVAHAVEADDGSEAVQDGQDGSFHVSGKAKGDAPVCALYSEAISSGEYFEVTCEQLKESTEAAFAKGYKCRGLFFGGPGNLANGGGLLRGNFGDGLQTGSVVGFLSDIESSTVKVTFMTCGSGIFPPNGYMDNKSFCNVLQVDGCPVCQDPSAPIFPVIQAKADGDKFRIVKATPPKERRREPAGGSHFAEAEDKKFHLSAKVANTINFQVVLKEDPSAAPFEAVEVAGGMSTMMMGTPGEMEVESVLKLSERVSAFLANKGTESPDMVVGMLSVIKDDTNKEIKVETDTEDRAVHGAERSPSAGFSSQQDNIIQTWGCSTPSVVYDSEGGTDISIAEKKVAYACNIEFPRLEGGTYYGVVGPCGGHTNDYHFHRSLSCLYSQAGGHSTKERKMKTIGEKQVEAVNLKRELADQGDSIADDKKMLADCLLTIRHGTGREQRYGPRYRMLSCGYNIDGTQICTASEDRCWCVAPPSVTAVGMSAPAAMTSTAGCGDLTQFPKHDHPELKKGEELYWLHHAGWLTSITFGQYDRLLLTTSRDRVARIWDIGHMELRVAATKWKLEDPIHHATFSPDQTRVAFASGAQRYFGVVSVYHTERGQVDGGGHQITAPLGLIEHPDSVSCVAFSSNHRYLGSGCLDGPLGLGVFGVLLRSVFAGDGWWGIWGVTGCPQV